MLEAIGAHADDLWRSGHPAAADTREATATALRDSDKSLAKRQRRYPAMQLAVPARNLAWRPSIRTHGLQSLPVVLTTR